MVNVLVSLSWLVFCAVGCAVDKQTAPMGGMSSQREQMVREQLQGRDITDGRVLDAMRHVPRQAFVPEQLQRQAYADHPLPIGEGQTISQPYIVALMTQLVSPQSTDKVLEVGTGSGYQAAVLAELAQQVYTIEILPDLGERARQTLASLGYKNIEIRIGDGYLGWPDAAPFDCIVVTAAPSQVPPRLLEQLAEGGRLVIPVDNEYGYQTLTLITRRGEAFEETAVSGCAFVPLVDSAGRKH